eukprot:TRINITY_DN13513_c0_g1_i1.p1 TRINITY_DN13513_c0_g1~~TRINITY_DN13513_c0_g1_i1.p1  ORF type:complete len:347 (+),score=40.58 TRINITY_DN13513_c0_g1_i1:99-1139(+)
MYYYQPKVGEDPVKVTVIAELGGRMVSIKEEGNGRKWGCVLIDDLEKISQVGTQKRREKRTNIPGTLLTLAILIWVCLASTYYFTTKKTSGKWRKSQGAFTSDHTLHTAEWISESHAKKWCDDNPACHGFTYQTGSYTREVFFKTQNTVRNHDPDWVSLWKEESPINEGTVAKFSTPAGELRVSLVRHEMVVSFFTLASGCGGKRKNSVNRILRVEKTPPNWGENGFFGPPYALLQGDVVVTDNSMACPRGALTPVTGFDRSIARHSLCCIRHVPMESLQFFIAAAPHPEWAGSFEVWGHLEPSSVPVFDHLLELQTQPATWGTTIVQALKNPLPIEFIGIVEVAG